MTSPTRDAAHVLLDLMTTFDPDAPEGKNSAALDIAFERINGINAVTATQDDETGELTLDVTPLLTASGFLLRTLMLYAADKSGSDPLVVVSALRSAVDEDLD